MLNAFPNLFLFIEVGVKNPACVQCMIAINWPLLILTDSPEFPRMLTLVLKAWENHGKTMEKAWGKFHGFP